MTKLTIIRSCFLVLAKKIVWVTQYPCIIWPLPERQAEQQDEEH